MSHELSQYLSAANSRGPIVLIIDALDQLCDTYDGSAPLRQGSLRARQPGQGSAPLRLPCLALPALLESFSYLRESFSLGSRERFS